MKKVLLVTSMVFSLCGLSQTNPLVKTKYTSKEILKLDIPKTDLRVSVSSRLNDKCYIDFDENTFNDPFGFGAYDIKMKLFVTPKIDYVQRIFITGVDKPVYFFSTGIILKP
jgi:hypothetical protein